MMEKTLKRLLKIVGKLPIPKSLKLTWQLHLIDYSYRLEIRDLRNSKQKDHEKLFELEALHRLELSGIYEELDALHTRKLIRQARRLRVPVPSKYDDNRNLTGFWEQGHNLGLWYFTHEGLEQIRSAIRNELKWHYQRREHYTNWITGLIGIIGVTVGLFIGWLLN